MNTPPMLRVAARSLMALGLARALSACAGADEATGGRAPDAAVSAEFCDDNRLTVGTTCDQESQCRRNLTCVLRPGDTKKTCQPVTGVCGGASEFCFEGARCASNRCLFSPVPETTFQGVSATVGLTTPTAQQRYALSPGAAGARVDTFQWSLPTGLTLSPEAVVVAAVLNAPPRRRSGTNTLANPDAIQWIWTSDTAAGGTMLRAELGDGRRGITRDGSLLGPALQTLPPASYWWLVYVLERGTVVAVSEVRTFEVYDPTAPAQRERCQRREDCVGAGQTSLQFDCVAQRCVRRCSSDGDCVGATRCDLVRQYCDEPRNGGHCEPLP
ncbi:MAG: hypothetical protein JNK72_17485 [Myxococcales bacterium]|nr:hypothetical protein [Myxococcales bacterium]